MATITRKGFIAGAAATAAAAPALSSLALAEDETGQVPSRWDSSLPDTWDRSCEMLVLGVGIGGACGLLEGYELGLDVLGVEAGYDIKETAQCRWSGGAFNGCCTSFQESEGIEDSVDLFVSDVIKAGEFFGDPEIIRAWAEISGSTIDWLYDLGCDIAKSYILDGPGTGAPVSPVHSVARVYYTNPRNDGGYGWMLGVENAINDYGIEVMYGHRATHLYRNAEGRVVGARVETPDGGDINIEATKGVLVSCGAYGWDPDLWSRYLPAFGWIRDRADEVLYAIPNTIRGDGIKMLEEVDAHMYNTYLCGRAGGTKTSADNMCDGNITPWNWADGQIQVNPEGKRFYNETSFYDFWEMPYLDQPGMSMLCVIDDVAYNAEKAQTFAKPRVDKIVAAGIEGEYGEFETLDELAEYFGINAEGLKQTVEEFNARCDEQSEEPDEFGRTLFNMKIETPPFHGIHTHMIFTTPKGGAKITAGGQVVDNTDQPIPGLYAAGEAAMFQCHGDSNVHVVGGCNSSAANFGRISARSIAAQA